MPRGLWNALALPVMGRKLDLKKRLRSQERWGPRLGAVRGVNSSDWANLLSYTSHRLCVYSGTGAQTNELEKVKNSIKSASIGFV